MRAAPLGIEKGEVDPSALALRLKTTSIKGGIVELPSDADASRHFYMLRAADHERPLVNATSSFVSPLTNQINRATSGRIDGSFIDLLEQIPASYLVIHNDRMPPEQQAACDNFLVRELAAGRLRFVNRFDGAVDLYAIIKNEPDAQSEAPLPLHDVFIDWGTEIRRDPRNLLAQVEQSQELYRMLLTVSGKMPRYSDFMQAINDAAAQVDLGSDTESEEYSNNLKKVAAKITAETALQELDNRHYVNRLITNSGIAFDDRDENDLVRLLDQKGQSRADILLKIANDERIIEKDKDRSLLLLYYFGYLRRNPDDPPDGNLNGFNFWLRDLAQYGNTAKIANAFQESGEFQSLKSRNP
jgi:hypothetical protein